MTTVAGSALAMTRGANGPHHPPAGGERTEPVSAQQRRGRDARRAAKSVDDECDPVDVAPAPVFAGFERADDRVRCVVLVSGRVAVGGVVAAADVAAGEADP